MPTNGAPEPEMSFGSRNQMRPFRSAWRPRVAMLSEANADARCWKRTPSANAWFPTHGASAYCQVEVGGRRRPDLGAVDGVELEDLRGLLGVEDAGRVVAGAEVDRPLARGTGREGGKAPGRTQPGQSGPPPSSAR